MQHTFSAALYRLSIMLDRGFIKLAAILMVNGSMTNVTQGRHSLQGLSGYGAKLLATGADPTHRESCPTVDFSTVVWGVNLMATGNSLQNQAKTGERESVPHIPNCSTCTTRHLSVCAALGQEELVAFDHTVQHRGFPAKAVLFDQGSKAEFVYSVSDGTIRLFRLLPDGRRQIIGFAIKGDFLGVAMDEVHEYSAEAVDHIHVCRITRPAFSIMLDEKPHLLKKLHQLAGREIHNSQDQIVLLGRKNAEERVAAFLLSFRERLARVATRSVTIPLPMSRQDIADYLGLTIETVSRTISKLAREKLIVVVPDGIRILDLERLAGLAEG